MFEPFSVTSEVLRFDGENGWFYVPFDDDTSELLRPLVTDKWPALLKVRAQLDGVRWTATVMPIKDGPLFVALTAPIRKQLGIAEGHEVSIAIEPL